MKSFSELKREFEESILPVVIEQYGANDELAINEAWIDFVNAECEAGEISVLQYHYCPAFKDCPNFNDLNDDRWYILDQLGISISYERTNANPVMPDAFNMDHWQVRVSRGKESMGIVFSKGYGHNGESPSILEVIHCLMMDYQYRDHSLEEFADEMGYEYDSPDLARSIRGIRKQAREVERVFGDDLIDKLTDLFANY